MLFVHEIVDYYFLHECLCEMLFLYFFKTCHSKNIETLFFFNLLHHCTPLVDMIYDNMACSICNASDARTLTWIILTRETAMFYKNGCNGRPQQNNQQNITYSNIILYQCNTLGNRTYRNMHSHAMKNKHPSFHSI